MKKEDGDPDLILILSCLWDTNRWRVLTIRLVSPQCRVLVRWGPDGITEYRQNCERFLTFIRETFSPDVTQLVWLTSPPVSLDSLGWKS